MTCEKRASSAVPTHAATERVETYTDTRLSDGAQPSTINRELAALKRMYSIGVQTRRGFRYRPYIPMLAEDNAREGFLEPADFDIVRTHLPDDIADFATFAYLTGWRKSEVVGLEWRDVDLRAGVIRLRAAHSKNKRPRVIRLVGDVRDLIERRAAARRPDCPRVFHRDGRPIGSFRKTWHSACKAAGFEGVLFHDLRRSAVRNMVRAGVTEVVAMRVSGHRTRSVFDRYDITSEARSRSSGGGDFQIRHGAAQPGTTNGRLDYQFGQLFGQSAVTLGQRAPRWHLNA